MKIQTVLITGASSGIGLKLAEIFAKNHFNLIIVARNLKSLDEISKRLENDYHIVCKTIAKDLSEQNSAQELFNDITNKNIKVDILINNAGFGNYGFFPDTDFQTDTELINVNISALTQLTKLFVKEMLKNNYGKILNVSSVAAFLPGPFMNTYFASKAYVLNFSVALSNELKDKGIKVSCLCPGPTPTNFGKRAHYKFSLKHNNYTSVEYVAEYAYKGLMEGKCIIIPGIKNKIIAFLSGFFSKKLLALIVRRVSGF